MKIIYTILLLLASIPAFGQGSVIGAQSNPVISAILQSATIPVGATNAFGSTSSPLSQLQDGTSNAPLPNNCNAPSNNCIWSSSNTAVATIDQTGLATALTAGTTTITYTNNTSGIPVVGTALLTVTAVPTITTPTCATQPCALPLGTNSTAYSFTFTAIGGTTPYTWSITSGSFTACNVSLAGSTGILSGTATTGTCTATVKVTDNLGLNSSIQVSLNVTSTASCGPSNNYNCSSNSVATIQTPAPPFNSSSSNGTTCVAGTSNGSGNGLLNSIGYDTSINPSGVDPITRASDCTQISGQSMQATPSGGDNDEVWNCAGRTDTSSACSSATLYYVMGIYGAVPFIEGIEKTGTGGAAQVVAPFPTSSASSPIPAPRGPAAFSNQLPNVLFMEAAVSGDPKIFKATMDGGTGHTPTATEVTLYDVGASCSVLPNGTSFGQQYVGGFSHDINDNIFVFDASPVVPIAVGVNTISVVNGSTAFTLSGTTPLLTNGSDVYAQIKINGGTVYTIASVTGSGFTGTLTTPYAGATSSGVSVAILGGQGSGIYQIAVQISPAACQVINTYSGTSQGTGAWSSSATGTLDSGCTQMRIHDSFVTRDGEYIQTSGASTGIGCGTQSIFPEVGTTHEVVCTATVSGSGLNLCVGGHDAFGYHNIVITQNPQFVNFPPQNANSGTPFTAFGSVPASGAFTDTYSNLDDSLSGWQYPTPCYGPTCAGGTGTATAYFQTINNSTPSLDGESMEVGFTAQSGLSSGQTTNVLWPNKVGANSSATSFLGTYNVYLPTVSTVQALEFDQFQFVGGQRFMMGSECDSPTLAGGFWRIWNQYTTSWVTTTVHCTLLTTAAAWHSVVWATHRIPGDTSCTGGNPCMYYDSLTVDGTVYTGFPSEPSAPVSETDNIGIQFQIDAGYTATTVSAYLDEMSLQVSGNTGALVTANCQNHFSWRNATSGDAQPIIFGTDNNNYSTSASTSTYGYPTMNEIGALFSNGTIRRFGHNFILGPGNGSGCGTTNVGPFDNVANLFQAADAIGAVSQDGTMWVQVSSMLGLLGKDTKGYTRADLFVYLLQ
jgi:Bacterial Ig-like domain (group 2)